MKKLRNRKIYYKKMHFFKVFKKVLVFMSSPSLLHVQKTKYQVIDYYFPVNVIIYIYDKKNITFHFHISPWLI